MNNYSNTTTNNNNPNGGGGGGGGGSSFGSNTNAMSNRKTSCLFPFKVHKLLHDASIEGFESIVSWLPSSSSNEGEDNDVDLHLKAEAASADTEEAAIMVAIQSGLITPFRVHKPKEFETQIMPRYVFESSASSTKTHY